MNKVTYLLRALKEEKTAWEKAAKKESRTLASWIKYVLNKAAAKVNK